MTCRGLHDKAHVPGSLYARQANHRILPLKRGSNVELRPAGPVVTRVPTKDSIPAMGYIRYWDSKEISLLQ